MHRHGALPADRQLTMSSSWPKVAWRPLTAVRSPSLSTGGGAQAMWPSTGVAPNRARGSRNSCSHSCIGPHPDRRRKTAALHRMSAWWHLNASWWPSTRAGAAREIRCATPAIGGAVEPRCVSSAVGVATFGLSSSTYTPHWMVHRVQPAVSVESLRPLAAVRLRTNGSTTRVGPPGPAWANTNGFVPQ